jgi:hypothetical protein
VALTNNQLLAAPYAAGADNVVAQLLAQVRAGITVNRRDIAPVELLDVLDARDFQPNTQVTTLAAQYFGALLRLERIPLTTPGGAKNLIRANLDRAVLNTNGSQTRLDALAVRTGSRFEQLFGEGLLPTADDVSAARRAAANQE